jgi:predicted SAM-dependent methyltransferase
MQGSYIQFGCGTCAPPNWRNFDAGPAFWLQKHVPFSKSYLLRKGYPEYPVENIEYGDVVAGLPVENNSATAVYCSHVLEHLALSDFRRAIRNVFQYLRPHGVFRLVVPDLEYLIRQYCADSDAEAALKFLYDAHLGESSATRGLRSLPQALFGRSRHLWMWDYKSMARELVDAGFAGVRRASFGDSEDLRFSEVESRGRWENCLGIECKKP